MSSSTTGVLAGYGNRRSPIVEQRAAIIGEWLQTEARYPA